MRTHGGNIYRHAGMLDFSANISPLGMPEPVRRAIRESAADCIRYPDPDCTALTAAIAGFEACAPTQIVCGNGAADLIFRIVSAFRPRRALVCAPTFSEYAHALMQYGSSITEYLLDPARDFRPDDSILSAVTDETDMVFLCTPNNPTGQLIDPALLRKISEICAERKIPLVCDECFLRFCADAAAYSLRPYLQGYCIILHAFTKLFAMPGLRLGYALCGSPETAETLRNTGQFWSVSVPAQAAGIAALQCTEHISKTVQFIAQERAFLADGLRASGIRVFESSANFLLLTAPADFKKQMAQRGIMVRTCADFHGLSVTYFRIAVRTHEENERLLAAVREVYTG